MLEQIVISVIASLLSDIIFYYIQKWLEQVRNDENYQKKAPILGGLGAFLLLSYA